MGATTKGKGPVPRAPQDDRGPEQHEHPAPKEPERRAPPLTLSAKAVAPSESSKNRAPPGELHVPELTSSAKAVAPSESSKNRAPPGELQDEQDGPQVVEMMSDLKAEFAKFVIRMNMNSKLS